VKRITKAALGGLAGGALVLGGTQTAIGESVRQLFSGNVLDLGTRTGTTEAFDSAVATLKVTETPDGKTTLWVRVKGIDADFAGKTFGSHLHMGVCDPKELNPYDAVGPHYKRDPGAETSRENEVWFDFVPNEEGVAVDKVVVPVAFGELVAGAPLVAGAHSIVIHAQATNEQSGSAGPREVCLPLAVDSGTEPLPGAIP
jgi:Cu/Zn superoxide dismutase